MNAIWPEFLQQVGARLDANGDTAFADEPADLAALDDASVIVPLANWSVLAANGPESAKFLQGQLTCNVLDVSDSHSVTGAFCTPKGRTLASFQLARRDPASYWLRMRSDIVEPTAAALAKYAVFSKTKLAPAEELLLLGLHGAAAAAAITAFAGSRPTARHGVVQTAGGLILQCDDAGLWFECWLPAAEAAALWQHCTGSCVAAGSRYWRWLNVRAGIAEIGAATRDQFIPQMLNYRHIGAISFNKGCYTGQEIVARAHYRGQVKRHLYRAAVDAPPPAIGTELRHAGGRAIGSVVEAVAIAADRSELLVVLGGDAWETGEIRLGGDGDNAAPAGGDGPALRPLGLPYAIT
jgi:folate-binding protein YgfZ